ncbi:MAG: hypothetical protein CM1200mP38_8240 [Dehalococcoidia bacterium]|nr:MAG: hypothetical protein CM1200mP38_8240 [Dehalococcoidia bacterium]
MHGPLELLQDCQKIHLLFHVIDLKKIAAVLDLLIAAVSFVMLVTLAGLAGPICVSPISPSSSAFGTSAATLSNTTVSMAPLRTRYSQISRLSSAESG